MPELKELAEAIEKTVKGVDFIQTELDSVKTQLEGMDGYDKERFEKACNDVTQGIEDFNTYKDEQKTKQDELEKEVQTLMKKLSRAGVKGDEGQLSDQEKAYKSQFNRYLRKGITIDNADALEDISRQIVEKTYFDDNQGQFEHLVKDLVAGVKPDGGYYVRPELATFVIDKVTETSNLRAVANVVNVTSDAFEIIIDDEDAVTGGWVGEVSSRGNTGTPQLGRVTIPVHEQFAQPRMTQKIIDDAGIDLEAWLTGKIASEFSRVENTAFVRGDGSEKPKGILTYGDAADPDVYERGLLGTREAAGAAIAGDDLKLLQNHVKERYQAAAIWAMRRLTFGSIITLKDDQGQYIFSTRFLRDQDMPTLLGKDVRFWDDLDNVGSESIPVLYGDFGIGYTIVDRFGIRVIRDELTEKPYIKLYSTKRVGGDVTNYDSIKRLRMPT